MPLVCALFQAHEMRNFLVMLRAMSPLGYGGSYWMYALMSDFKMLCCHVSLVPRLEPETTGHVNKAKLQQSLLMDVDLPLGTEQALMLHSVYIIPCILLS